MAVVAAVRQQKSLLQETERLTASLIQGSRLKDECVSRHRELRKMIDVADQTWKSLESQLENIEDSLTARLGKRLNFKENELGTSADDARNAGRHQLQKLLLHPLRNVMEDKVDWTYVGEETPELAEVQGERHLLVQLSSFCDGVFAKIEEAVIADKKLDKQIKKTEKDERSKGIISLGMQDTKAVATLKRHRASIWERPMSALCELAEPVSRLNLFVVEEMTPDKNASILAQAPGILLRSMCDWHFGKNCAELTQLQRWWDTTKNALSSNEKIWDGLQNKEGLFIQRIEKGLETIGSKKSRYLSFADFGGVPVQAETHPTGQARVAGEEFWSPKLEDSFVLLTQVLAEMRDGLGVIRNSAMWRVVASARELRKELEEPPPLWDTVSISDGARTILARVDEGAAYKDRCAADLAGDDVLLDGDALEDMLLMTMKRLDSILEISSEVEAIFGKNGLEPREDIACCMDSIAKITAEMNEELLAVLDEPSPSAAQEWLELWSKWDGSALARGLENNLRIAPLAKLTGEAFALRQEKLLLLRGLQSLLQGGEEVRLPLVDALSADLCGMPRHTQPREPTDIDLSMRREDISLSDVLSSAPPTPTGDRPACPSITDFGVSIPQSAQSQNLNAEAEFFGNDGDAAPTMPAPQVSTTSPKEWHSSNKTLFDFPVGNLFAGVEKRPWAGELGHNDFMRDTSSQPLARGSRCPASSTRHNDPWDASDLLTGVTFSKKSLLSSSSQPMLHNSRRRRDHEEILREVREIRAPALKFVNGERIPLRPSSSQTRLLPVSLRPSPSLPRLPSIAWS